MDNFIKLNQLEIDSKKTDQNLSSDDKIAYEANLDNASIDKGVNDIFDNRSRFQDKLNLLKQDPKQNPEKLRSSLLNEIEKFEKPEAKELLEDFENSKKQMYKQAKDAYLDLQTQIADKNAIEAEDKAKNDFAIAANALIKLSSSPLENKETMIQKINDLLENSIYGKIYASDEDKIEVVSFLYDAYDKQGYKNIAIIQPIHNRFLALPSEEELIEKFGEDGLDEIYNDINLQTQKEMFESDLLTNIAIEDFNNEIETIESGAILAINKNDDISFQSAINDLKYIEAPQERINNLLSQKEFSETGDKPLEPKGGNEFFMSQLEQNTYAGLLTNDEISNMVASKELTIEEADSLRTSILDPNDPIQLTCIKDQQAIVSKYNNRIDFGLKSQEELYSDSINNPQEYQNSSYLSNIYSSMMQDLVFDIKVNKIDEKQYRSRIEKIYATLEGQIVSDQQNVAKEVPEVYDTSSLLEQVSSLHNGTGGLVNKNRNIIDDLFIKYWYGTESK